MNAQLKGMCEKLENCDFDSKSFRDILDAMQKIIDEMNLASLSNLQEWVKSLDARVETTLLSRLSDALKHWSSAFDTLTTKLAVEQTSKKQRRRRGYNSSSEEKNISVPDIARALGLNIKDSVGIEVRCSKSLLYFAHITTLNSLEYTGTRA
jgi:hypothetical protein